MCLSIHFQEARRHSALQFKKNNMRKVLRLRVMRARMTLLVCL